MKRYLILEDGTVFSGDSVGSSATSTGELVITNNVSGIEQAITDQTYNDQIIVFMAPVINRSEERRVGKECRSRRSPQYE